MLRSNTAVIRVGRLLEVRLDAGFGSPAEVDVFFEAIHAQIAKLPGGHVSIVDRRRCPVMAPPAAQRMIERVAGVTDRLVRAAVIARQDSPIAVLQFARLIREVGFADRKLFFDVEELVGWLDPVLMPHEQLRLREYFQETAGAQSTPAGRPT